MGRTSAATSPRRGQLALLDRASLLLASGRPPVYHSIVRRRRPPAVALKKCGLNEVEIDHMRRDYEIEQGLTAEMMEHPDSKVASRQARRARSRPTSTLFSLIAIDGG